MASATKHLSVQLLAPEQRFCGKSATNLVFVGIKKHQKTELSRSAKMYLAKHRIFSQGTNQQITEHKPAKDNSFRKEN